MELRRLSTAELQSYLENHAPAFQDLVDEERASVMRMARRLAERELAPRFILAAVNSTVNVLRASAVPSTTEAPPPEAIAFPPMETRPLAAGMLAASARDAIREARSARRSNEVRRMRGVLRSIDQGKLREALGDEGVRLCQELNQTLARLEFPVRRGRPRTQRVAA